MRSQKVFGGHFKAVVQLHGGQIFAADLEKFAENDASPTIHADDQVVAGTGEDGFAFRKFQLERAPRLRRNGLRGARRGLTDADDFLSRTGNGLRHR